MGKFIAVVVVVAAIGYAWYAGWIASWVGSALDSSADSVRNTQQSRKVRTDEKQ